MVNTNNTSRFCSSELLKARVLARLRDNSGSPVSGEQLSMDCAVSRTAIWKAVHELIQDGYTIAAEKNGYRYIETGADYLFPAEFQESAASIHYTALTASTMDSARTLALKGAVEGTIVIAEEQSAGKGRKNRRWISTKGSLLFTMILRPGVSLLNHYQYTLLCQLALAEALAKYCKTSRIEIKWPNDILIKKDMIKRLVQMIFV